MPRVARAGRALLVTVALGSALWAALIAGCVWWAATR